MSSPARRLSFDIPSPRVDKRGKPTPFPGYNDHERWARGNRMAAASKEKGYVEYVARFASAAARQQGWECPTMPVRITLTWREANRRRDQDGLRWFEKPLLDGLQKAGVIRNDNQECIEGCTRHALVIDPQHPGVSVYIECATEQEKQR